MSSGDISWKKKDSSPHTAAQQILAGTDTQSHPTLCDTGRRSGRVRWCTGSSGSRSVCQWSRRDTGSGSLVDPPEEKTQSQLGDHSRSQQLTDSGTIRTLQVAPFLHWPWQRFRSAKDNSRLVGVVFLGTRRDWSKSIHGEVQSTSRMFWGEQSEGQADGGENHPNG